MSKILMFRSLLLIGLIIHAYSAGFSQHLSFEQCVDYAFENHTKSLYQQADINKIEKDLSYAKWEWLPSVYLGGSMGMNFGRSIDPFTNDFTNKPVTSLDLNTNVQFSIYEGGRRIIEKKQKQTQLRLSHIQVREIRQKIVLDLANGFLQILLAKEQVVNNKSSLEQIKKQQNQSMLLIEAGQLPAYYLFELEAELLGEEYRLKEAQQKFERALQEFRQRIQYPEEQPFNLILPDTAILLAPPSQHVKVIYRYASKVLPELKMIELEEELAELRVKGAKTSSLPRITANAMAFTGYSNQRGEFNVVPGDPFNQLIGFVSSDGGNTASNFVYAEQIPFEQEFTKLTMGQQFQGNVRRNLGISINFPVFNGMKDKNRIEQARIEGEKIRIKKKESEQLLQQKLETLKNDTQDFWELFQLSVKRLEAVQSSFSALEEKYKLGRINISELLRAQKNLRDTQYSSTVLKYNYLYKRKLLLFYLGEEISF